jgi:hypothetical protein
MAHVLGSALIRVACDQTACQRPSRPGILLLLPAGSNGGPSSSMDRDDPAYRGQSDYNRLLLAVYDPLVLGPIARFVWRCPTSVLLARYRQRIRPPHLDVGPGTGFFLDKSGLPDGSPVAIVDPNATVLDHATRSLRRLDVTTVEADVLKPLPIHCLPGPLSRKSQAVANVAAVLAPTGVLFGASVLGSVIRSRGARDRRFDRDLRCDDSPWDLHFLSSTRMEHGGSVLRSSALS